MKLDTIAPSASDSALMRCHSGLLRKAVQAPSRSPISSNQASIAHNAIDSTSPTSYAPVQSIASNRREDFRLSAWSGGERG